MKFKSFRSLLFLSFVVALVLSFLSFVLVSYPRIKSVAQDQAKYELAKQTRIIAPEISEMLLGKKTPAEIQSTIRKITSSSGDRISIILPAGKVIADSFVKSDKLSLLENHSGRPEIVSAQRSGLGYSVRYSSTTKKDLMYVAIPLKSESGAVAGYLRLSTPITYSDVLMGKIYKSLLLAFLVSILIALVFSFFVSFIISYPIIRLSKVAGKIADGSFLQRNLRKSYSEIGELESAIENMSDKLSASFRQLAEERSSMEAVFGAMSEAVIAVDQAGRIFALNKTCEQLFGVEFRKVCGRTPRETIRNNDISDMIELSRSERKELESEIRLFVPFDAVFSVHSRPIQDVSGIVIGAVCVLHDISRIRKLEKYRSEFIANISHELKTPLTAIRGYVDSLLNGGLDDAENRGNFAQKIDKHARSLSTLIDDILELSKIENSDSMSKFGAVKLKTIVGRAIEALGDKAAKKNISIVFEC